MDARGQLFSYALIPMVTMTLGGAIAVFQSPGPRLRSAVLHLAGGVIFAVVAVEFLPALLHEHAAAATGVGFGLGTAAMLSLRFLTQQAEAEERDGEIDLPAGLLFATGIDLAIDGLMLGIGFAAGAREGKLLTIALSIELLALGLATSATFTNRGFSRGKSVLMISALASLFFLCAVVGSLPLRNLSGDALAGLLAFGSAALLFLVTEELLTEAHEIPESPVLTAAFFLGFLLLFFIEMLNS